MNNELYDVLGISKNASDTEIKKAYHKCAQKYHPDKTQGDKEAEEKYKKCVHAYEVLMNPQKRKMYDMYGTTDNVSGMNVNPFDLFKNFGQQHSPVLHVIVTLRELYFGTKKEIKYQKKVPCDICHGVGSEKEPITCETCHGKGHNIKAFTQGFVQFHTSVMCETCKGQKVIIPEKDKCQSCHGEKLILKECTFMLDINKGSSWGENVEYNGFIVTLIQDDNNSCTKNNNWTRKHNDLHLTLTISFIQCITGKGIVIDHLNGEKILVNYDGIIQPGTTKKLINYGMPTKNNSFGDLYIFFNVFMEIEPTILNNIIQMYPPQAETDTMLNDVNNSNSNPEEQSYAHTTCNQQ